MSRVYTETYIAVYPEISRFKANKANYDYLSPFSYLLRLILTILQLNIDKKTPCGLHYSYKVSFVLRKENRYERYNQKTW